MTWSPVSPLDLPVLLAERLAQTPGVVRVALDGPPCAHPDDLADALVEPLRALSRPVAHVRASSFWRDASLRLEYGRNDVDSYLGWLDHDALRREVLVPAVERAQFLPSLRDPVTNRSTRAAPRPIAPDTILLVSGALLLGLGLPFELIVHQEMSPPARARHTSDEDAWTLPAFDRYDAEVAPTTIADVVVRLEDPRRPAVRGLRAIVR